MYTSQLTTRTIRFPVGVNIEFLVTTFNMNVSETTHNVQIPGRYGKPVLLDIFNNPNGQPKPVVIFAHGFKGFKDWGHFNLVAERFAQKGFVFVKFNFSHNGTTPEQPTDFADLEAFGNNNFSIELDDLGSVIDFVLNNDELINEIDKDQLALMGHSRGGGVVILRANEDHRVKKIVTWSAVNDFETRWPEEQIEEWKEKGVVYIENARTHQQMPLYYQLYEDYFTNLDRLKISTAVKNLKIPFLIVHGTDDEAVPYSSAVEMHDWNPASQLLTIENGNHVFGARHPYEETDLPDDAEKVVSASIEFLRV